MRILIISTKLHIQNLNIFRKKAYIQAQILIRLVLPIIIIRFPLPTLGHQTIRVMETLLRLIMLLSRLCSLRGGLTTRITLSRRHHRINRTLSVRDQCRLL